MPKVGNKKFPYTKSGKAAAAKEAKATGKPMKKAKHSSAYKLGVKK